MSLFGKSFEEKVKEAIAQASAKVPAARNVHATIEGKVVTLKGEAPDIHSKQQIMKDFNALVETERTVNGMTLAPAPAAAPAAAAPAKPAGGAGAPGAAPVAPAQTAPANVSPAPAPATPAAAPAAAAPAAERIHEVVSGDTLSAIAKKYYGNAGKYMKIFEANKDQLKDPDKIKVGQKLKIPE